MQEMFAQSIMYLGLIVGVGAFLGHLVSRIGLPTIAGYVLAGILLGPTALKIVPVEMTRSWIGITDIAIAFLAFSVGSELFIPKIRKHGVGILFIAMVEVLLTMAIVTAVLYLVGLEFSISLLLGALAASTSPAPLLLIKKQFSCKTDFVQDAITVTAVDDALGIIVFGVAKTFVEFGGEATNTVELLKPAIYELGVSLLFGLIIGLVLGLLINTFSKRDDDSENAFYLELTFVVVFVSIALAYLFEGSVILLPLVAGMSFTNVVGKDVYDRETKVVDLFSLPFLIIFFAIAGVQINASALKSIWYIGLLYVVLRGVGKYFGGMIGAVVTKQKRQYVKQIGVLLLPLGGVEIGLALSAQTVLNDEQGNLVRLVVLSGTLIYSILGTFVVSWSLNKSGDFCNIKEEDED